MLALWAAIVAAIAYLAGCATKPEKGARSRTITHPATRTVPFQWTEERMVRMDEHDTLYYDGKVIPGAPMDEPVIELNGKRLTAQ